MNFVSLGLNGRRILRRERVQFLACIKESIGEMEGRCLRKDCKLDMYKRFGKELEFKRYLHRLVVQELLSSGQEHMA